MKKRPPLSSTVITNEARRNLIKRFALSSVGIGAVSIAAITSTRAQADSHLVQLDEASPQSNALGYKHDRAEVDAAKYPQSAGDNKICANCQLYKAMTEDGWGACPIFAGKLVNSNGWCSAWVPVAKG